MNIIDLKKFWDAALLDKKITQTFYDGSGFTVFMLNDGIKIEYDRTKGLYISKDNKTNQPIKYH